MLMRVRWLVARRSAEWASRPLTRSDIPRVRAEQLARPKVGVPGRLVGKVFPWTSTLTFPLQPTLAAALLLAALATAPLFERIRLPSPAAFLAVGIAAGLGEIAPTADLSLVRLEQVGCLRSFRHPVPGRPSHHPGSALHGRRPAPSLAWPSSGRPVRRPAGWRWSLTSGSRPRPVEAESEVSDHRQPAGRRGSSDDGQAKDGAGRRPCRTEPGAEAALEQDHEERDSPDLFEPDHRQVGCGRDFQKACRYPYGQERSLDWEDGFARRAARSREPQAAVPRLARVRGRSQRTRPGGRPCRPVFPAHRLSAYRESFGPVREVMSDRVNQRDACTRPKRRATSHRTLAHVLA